MALRVAYLWGFFGGLSEGFIAEEILAAGRCGVEADIISFRPAEASAASALEEQLRPAVRYLAPGGSRLGGAARCAAALVARPWTWWRGHAAFPRASLPARLAEGVRGAALGAWLARALERRRPHVLHAQHGHIGWMALPVAERAGLPMVVSLRGQDLALLEQLAGGRLAEFRRVPARFLARCKDMAEQARRLGLPEGAIFVHPSGVAVGRIAFRERTAPPGDEPVIFLSVGRLVEKKGMADAISALAASRHASHRAVLRIAGDGPEAPALEKLARQLGVNARVQLLGPLPHEWALAEMARAHVFVLASRRTADGDREGIPNAIKEAAASGLPVLSTTHGGIPEVVEHGVSGLLAAEGDVEGLSKCMDEMVGRCAEWPAMGRRGRQIVEQGHDVDRLAPSLVEHYRAVLSEASAR